MRTMTDDLHLDLLGSPIAAGLARTLITQRIAKWGHHRILDDVLLVASELIVNAAEATPNAQIKLRLGRNTQGVFVGVWDSSPALPQAKPVTELTLEGLDASPNTWDNGGGWGLPIVDALSATCGLQPDQQGGKWLWATFLA